MADAVRCEQIREVGRNERLIVVHARTIAAKLLAMHDEDWDLHWLANEHWRLFYRDMVDSLGGEWRRFGNVDAFSTPHLPAAFANGVLAIEPATADDLVD